MSPEIIDCEQGTPEWFAARAGIPTASEFSTVLSEGRADGTLPNAMIDSLVKEGCNASQLAAAVKAAKAGSIEFRAEKAGIVHAGVGKASFSEDAIAANVRALVTAINRAKPSGAKGTFIKKVSISSTMGPGVKLDPATAINA